MSPTTYTKPFATVGATLLEGVVGSKVPMSLTERNESWPTFDVFRPDSAVLSKVRAALKPDICHSQALTVRTIAVPPPACAKHSASV